MAGIGTADVVRLERIVGLPTLARGRRYASAGAVAAHAWDEAGEEVVGEVHGTASRPYRVAVRIRRGGDDALCDIEARCTCPVAVNCKHAVALLLHSSPRLRLASAPAPAPPDAWEQQLLRVLGRPVPEAPLPLTEVGALGIEFELVRARPLGRQVLSARPGIRVRPVVRTASGSWVRGGVSWGRLEYLSAAPRLGTDAAAQVALLRELHLLHALGTGRAVLPGEDAVWLESIATRRVWDLLEQASELGMPLLGAGRAPVAVTLERRGAEVVIEASAEAGGIVLRPELRAGEEVVDLGAALLLGNPAHGIAWWQGVPQTQAPLHLAPLALAVDEQLAALVRSGTIRVPAADVERFWRTLYPALRRRLPLRSSDGSVELPEPGEDALVCMLSWEGTRARVSWAVSNALGTRALAEESAPGVVAARRAALALCARTPGLVVASPLGERLAPVAELSGREAAHFALGVLPALSAVEHLAVIESGVRPAFREVTEAPVVRLGGAETPEGDWLDLLVEVSVGGEPVPFQELFVALAAGEQEMLLPSGTLFSLERPELARLAALISEARALSESPTATARLNRYQASLFEDLAALAADTPAVRAWRRGLAALAEGGGAPVALPRMLQATLRPYQETGFQWLAARYAHRLGGILADDMGLGKTLQALALICHVREQELSDRTFLVVAPTSVVANWVSEAERFAPELRVRAITQTARTRGVALASCAADADVLVTSYALFRLDHEEYTEIEWAGALFDEAQFVKNPATQAHRAARRLRTPFTLALTGTPLENSLAELWALSALTAPGLFPRAERFAETYRIPIERHDDRERLAQLRRRIRPVMLRRRKEEVAAELPDKQEQTIVLDLHPRHRKIYDTYLQRERQKILGLLGELDENRFAILRSLTLLRQAALDVSLVDEHLHGVPATKLVALGEMLSEIVADGHRALVFSQFTRFLRAARDAASAAGLSSCYLDGATRRRPEVIASFRAGDAPLFFISLKAGGVGLNLAEADYCILLDPWWNPATEAQAIDRAHRLGQTRKVMVYRLVARDTIEEKVVALKERKARLFASVVDDGAFASGTLSAEDVRALLR